MRWLLSFLAVLFVLGLSGAFAPRPARAVNCDANACISACQKRGPSFGAGQGCTSWCLQTMEERKKKGQCK
jgi:hypothetical protein